MDDKSVIDRIVNILDSEAQNLVKGNITSPKPGSLCQVTTDYGVKEAYNINCTYPGDAYVVWDKEEEKYYCFTDKPSEVINKRQLGYRKRTDTEKLLKPLYALVTKKYIELQPVNGQFSVNASATPATATSANYSGSGAGFFGDGEVYLQYIEDDPTFTYPSTLSGSINYSNTVTTNSASYCNSSLLLDDVLINSKELLFTINGVVETTLSEGNSRASVDLIIDLVGYSNTNAQQYVFVYSYGEGISGVSESFIVTSRYNTFNVLNMRASLTFDHNAGVVSCNLNYSFSGVEYEPPYNLLLHTGKNKKSLNIYNKGIVPNKPVDCSITSLKDKILVNIKDNYTSRYERIIQRVYDYSLKLKEENIYIYDSNNPNNVPDNINDWLNVYHKTYNKSPLLPEYISENLDFLSNLLGKVLVQAVISDEDKKLIATKDMSIPVNYYDITTTSYTKKLKFSKILKLKKIEQATIMALSICKLL